MVEDRTKVSIIIVNWNGRHHLRECFDSLAAQTFRDFEVLLVDNGSVDASLELVRGHYPWVRLVPLELNTGFATGNNRGLEQARGTYIVTLNNDTRVEPDWLDCLVKTADAHRRAGMIGCRICSYSEPDILDSIGMGICRDGMARGRFRNQRWSALQMKDVEDILIPSACAALYKRAMIDEVGFFDDNFFAYAEDVDLGLRGRLAGWDALVANQAIVYHKYSQTSGRLSPFKVYLVERNHYWVVLKTFPWWSVLALPIWTLWRYVEQARSVLFSGGTGGEFRSGGSKGALIKALLKAMLHSLRGLPRVLRQRRHIMARKRLAMRDFATLLRTYRLTFRELLDVE